MTVGKLISDHIDIWSSALQTRSTAGRGSNGKIDLYGIKKLRELILELAVRGKLVPQDPNYEPASELLKRIAAEKAELVKQGKIKKQKPLPEISEDEKPFELPEGWEWVRLGTLGYTQTGGTPSKSNAEYYGNDIPFIKPADITAQGVIYDNEGLSIKGAETLGRVAPSGSILMVCIGTIGKCQVINRTCSFNQQINSITPFSDISDFIYLDVSSSYFQSLAWDYSSSTTIPILNKGKWESLLVPIAPLSEQARIVTNVKKLMSLCDQLEQQSLTSLDAHQQLVETLLSTLTDSPNAEELAENWARISQHFDTLFNTEASIDALKQTILQLAVMGKLVPQDPNDEPASELLKRIEQEKAQLVKEGKIKKQKPFPSISDDEKPFELPQGWEWCRIGEIIVNMDAGWSPSCSPEPSPNENIWGVLKTTAVQSLEYREQENKTLPSSKLPRPQYEVHDGDILVTRAGPKNRVGVSCLVEKTRSKLMISDKIIRFHLISDEISAKYISLCLNCGVTADYLEASKSGMAESQMNISQENLRSAPVALPPTAIQLKVISTIEDFFKVCDQLKSRLQAAQQTQLHLADALTEAALN
ncbi:restriction endonuclease subunit S [Enterobacter cloacae complex sp. S4]|uniref:restriction endonuclease subunit S n=1 Tax=Enterobacteriaceae TaxID=543 RepID=UPI000B40FB97|nr:MULTISPECIES: restriction endonuclease subunit S [Enterobacter cloacae complex]CAE6233880.1 Type-1 restriction enzyme EcoKI specificity protein [Enterobacter cloacae]ELD8599069.1 restriction endonuclease subunit S [Enterobacter roggenkampii]MBE4870145.1 restriction endonuclease subunit S [Enterobacter cloacae complex sp. S4]MCK7368641.1 restriction endonuclease subunit S [Enterobacter roggenkampii]MCU3128964.1 restriction endonuclease subunit S [Enterobacter roggenkampii]